jgi:hypothetical protein
MSDTEAIEALINDLQWQVDQLRSRGIKDNAGKTYNPAHYKRGLAAAVEAGGTEVVAFVQRYLYKPPSDGYKRMAAADALDLACESLVQDESKPYAHLFSDEDRAAACERLGPKNIETIEAQRGAHRARIDAARAKLRAKGMPSRLDLDGAIRSRKPGR